MGDDPRAGGDDPPRPADRCGARGRSPRGRGRPVLRGPRRPVPGTIPARAGTTPGGGDATSEWPDDPRAGGDDKITTSETRTVQGRSPRGRGRHADDVALGQRRRTIPARAGTTECGSRHPVVAVDDPRAGGDDDADLPTGPTAQGRSPRGRGRLLHQQLLVRGQRTIPARAGTTSRRLIGSGPKKDDPRAGGDDVGHERAAGAGAGRSPRGRGRLSTRVHHDPRSGTIPARAGTTGPHSTSRRARRDDPRAGGDDSTLEVEQAATEGRSPRGRGRRSGGWAPVAGRGTIPARAGTTADGN